MSSNTIFRRVRLPIKIKLIIIITFLLGVSLSIYLFFALDLFYKDKSAYIFENGLATSESVASQISIFTNDVIKDVEFLGNSYNATDKKGKLLKNLFNSLDSIVEFSIHNTSSDFKQIVGVVDGAFIKGNDLNANYFKELKVTKPLPFSKIIRGNEAYVVVGDLAIKYPYIQIAVHSKKFNQIWSAVVDISHFIDMFKQNQVYKLFLFDGRGKVILYEKDSATKEEISSLSELAKKNFWGSRELSLASGRSVLVSSSKVGGRDMVVFGQIDYDKAFLAASYLIKKSIYFGLFLISLASIIGILFSKTLTSSIEKLFEGTKKMANGEFDTSVTIKSRDEIGALSDSFNFMSKEIVRYMAEMEEKIRLKNELEVARLVQSSFFPSKNISVDGLNISAYYTPASECGGDWWGHFDNGDKTILMIADATGHGVPAALLTATANCCLSNIKLIGKEIPLLLNSPAAMMQLMNRAVHDAGSEIRLTCFIAVIDRKNGHVVYANASHNAPLLYRDNGAGVSKNNFKSMLCENGPHLGKEPDAEYTEASMDLKKKDLLLLFTDGLVEEVNEEGKQWGTRKFLKSIMDKIDKSPEELVNGVAEDVFAYNSSSTPSDDITLIAARVE